MLKLYLVDFDDDCDCFLPKSALTIDEYLTNPPKWKAMLDDIYLIFTSLSNNLNESMNSFGYLGFIIPQLIEIEKRLSQNRFAILRTAGEHQAIFYILEPKGDIVYLSFLGMLNEPYGYYFPLEKSPMYIPNVTRQDIELYNYIEENIENLKYNSLYGLNFLNIEIQKKELMISLIEQANSGTKLFNFIK